MPNSVLISGPAGSLARVPGGSACPRGYASPGGRHSCGFHPDIRRAQPPRDGTPITGLYPLRDAAAGRLYPIAEYVRYAAIGEAVRRDIQVVATNSDGSPEKRSRLLRLLGALATERIVTVARAVAERRLAAKTDGILLAECSAALDRWYGRYVPGPVQEQLDAVAATASATAARIAARR